jgi:hypothetical protein
MIDDRLTPPVHEQPSRSSPTAAARSRNLGRWIGAAMLLGFGVGMVSNFRLQSELFAAPGFLLKAAGQPLAIGTMVMLGIATALLSLAMATMLRERYGHRRPVLGALLVAVVTAGLAINVLEGALLLGMRSVSEAYLAAGTGAEAAYEPTRQLLRGLRNGIHFPNKLLGGLGVLLLFVLLLRQQGLPRALAGFGVVAAGTQMLAIMQFVFGGDVELWLLAPLALAYPATGIWLLARGLPPDGDRSG